MPMMVITHEVSRLRSLGCFACTLYPAGGRVAFSYTGGCILPQGAAGTPDIPPRDPLDAPVMAEQPAP